MAYYKIPSFDMTTHAQGFNQYITKPLAEFMGNCENADASEKEILNYNLKVATFNGATICGVAYAALALLGTVPALSAAIYMTGFYVIREIANPTTHKNFLESIGNTFTSYLSPIIGEKWDPDYLSWGNVCILKTLIISPNK